MGREDVKRKVCCDREIARACGRWVGDFWTTVVDARQEAGRQDSGFVERQEGIKAFGIKASSGWRE